MCNFLYKKKSKLNTPIELQIYINKLDFFSNACTAYTILLIVLETVAFTKISFSKL
jgi:hypothetical protein